VTGQPDRYVLGVAYQAGKDPDIKKGADGGWDYFTERELELASRTFLRKGGMIAGLFHADGTEGHAEIVESYIYRGPDWPQDDGSVIRKGDWLIGAVLDEVAWNLVQKGHITGWSPQGRATRRRTTRSNA
jgi:hypothetical protein